MTPWQPSKFGKGANTYPESDILKGNDKLNEHVYKLHSFFQAHQYAFYNADDAYVHALGRTPFACLAPLPLSV